MAITRTVRGHQNLQNEMEMLIAANQEAVVVLPRHQGTIMTLRESDTCHQSFVKQIICMKNKKIISGIKHIDKSLN